MIRHGQSLTNANVPGVRGDQHNHLTTDGITQAMNAGRNLLSVGFVPDVVISSDLTRAVQTASSIMSAMLHPTEVKQDKRIREMEICPHSDFIYEMEWVKQHGREHMDRVFNDPHFRGFETGETQAEVFHRTASFLDKEVKPLIASGQNVLVVTHMFVMRAAMCLFAPKEPEEMVKFDPKNCVPFFVKGDKVLNVKVRRNTDEGKI